MSQTREMRHAHGDPVEASFREVQNALDSLEEYLRQRLGYDGLSQPNPIDLVVRLRREITANSGRPDIGSPLSSRGARNPAGRMGTSA